jgi:CheY-like chemotaxis protein
MTHGEGVVLIVEDDVDDRDLLARAFNRAGIAVPLQFAKDGDEAVAYLSDAAERSAQAMPFIVLLDLKLPRRSGFEVLDWIKQHARLRRVPVIILTSS